MLLLCSIVVSIAASCQGQSPYTIPTGSLSVLPDGYTRSQDSAFTQTQVPAANASSLTAQVLQQAKTKAVIRVKAGRAQPVDWLAVTLAVVEPEHNRLDELENADLELKDLESLFDSLDEAGLQELEKGIDTYLALESGRSNHDYWTVCSVTRHL